MPRLEFENIINRDKGKTGFVLGLGPSLRSNIHEIKQIQSDKEKYKIISCNNIDLMIPELDIDYWMLAQPADMDNPFCIRRAWKRYNSKPNTTFLYTDCLDLTNRSLVAEQLTVDYIGYDQRHWKGEHCTWGKGPDGRNICCSGIIPGRLCIQEEFQKMTGVSYHYGAGDTVGVHMLALAVMVGLNPIYVSGIDLDYVGGYVNNTLESTAARVAMGISSMNNTPVMVERVLEDIKTIRNAAANIGVEIYDMNGNGKIASVLKHKKIEI